MLRYHKVLYRRLLRGQATDDLRQLRSDSAKFPTLVQLIDMELARRDEEIARWCLRSTASAPKRPLTAQPGGQGLS
ncbi:MAG: hypothetical protein JOZ51_01240 [Chloroflexi bacterium]|nr:hypothetical protein [Chloroflexota bacterium]